METTQTPLPPQTPPEPADTPIPSLNQKPFVAFTSNPSGRPRLKWALAIVLVLVVLGALAATFWWLGRQSANTSGVTTTKASNTHTTTSTNNNQASQAHGLQLDPSKNYGDKYANGLLPVGDGKYTADGPRTDYVLACSQYAQNLASGQGGGAQARGPWFTNSNTVYDINKKLHVGGSVLWQASFTNAISGTTRSIVTNDLPTHPTGIFPIQTSDPAYIYDRNPNHITGQSLTYALNANPTYSSTPSCMGGEAGIMLTGIALFNAFDAGGRDAGAWEVQDGCQGHPEKEGLYHYHTLSSCIKDTAVSTVIGFALDGFPITGPKLGANNILTTADLDACHGLTSQVTLDGKLVTSYHYVMTQDFPYSVSCFRGSASQPPDLKINHP